jgi:hypothetical protein
MRLALEVTEWRVFVGRGSSQGELCLVVVSEHGASVSCGSGLAESGLHVVSGGSSVGNTMVAGIVHDDVTAVVVNGIAATLGENAFLAAGVLHPEMTVMTWRFPGRFG